MTEKLPQIAIVDDHDLFRDGLKTLLELSKVGIVVSEASNGVDFLKSLDTCEPDIVLMDIEMPKLNGIDTLKKALELNPEIKVLVISMFGDHQYYYDIFTLGAKGFVFKTANKSELIQAINIVLNGGTYFSTDLLQQMVSKFREEKTEPQSSDIIHFNEKELEILSLMIEGLSAKEIADQTHLAPKTVSNYKTNMLEKTGCKNAVSLVVYAIKNNLIQL